MKHYELLTVLPGTLAEDEVQPVADQITAILNDHGAQELVVESKGKSRLAYPMKHIRYGYFHLYTFASEPGNIPAMQKKMKLVTGLLRSLISTYDPTIRKQTASGEPFTVLQEISRTPAPRSKSGSSRQSAPAPKKDAAAPKVETKEADSSDKESTSAKASADEKPVNMDEINKKLDSILDDSDIANV